VQLQADRRGGDQRRDRHRSRVLAEGGGDSSTHTAYVTNYGANTVSVISPGQAPAITSAGSARIGTRPAVSGFHVVDATPS
jgi:hypothetical protein